MTRPSLRIGSVRVRVQRPLADPEGFAQRLAVELSDRLGRRSPGAPAHAQLDAVRISLPPGADVESVAGLARIAEAIAIRMESGS